MSLRAADRVRIDLYRFDIPLRSGFSISGSPDGSAGNLLVAIHDGPLTGWGEASPVRRVTGESQDVCLAAARDIRKRLAGIAPADLSAALDAVKAAAPDRPTARSAFEMALYDLAAQRAGLPLHRFLGGAAKPLPTNATIFLQPPGTLAARAEELVGRGFSLLKVKLGAPERDDLARIREVREAVGDRVGLRVDANQGWDRDYAPRILDALAELGVEFCEQPLPKEDMAGLAELSRRSPVPLMADESLFTPEDARRLAEGRVFPLFNIKLSKSGGFSGASGIAELARAAGIPCMTGCMNESRLGLTATAHFAAAESAVRIYDLDSILMQTEDFIEGGLRIERGTVHLPDTPGLGARPAEHVLRRLVPEQ